MSRTIGENLYRYTLRDGQFSVHEGTVIEGYGHRQAVHFKGTNSKANCPREEDIGVVSHGGITLWLTEKNDELAKDIFVKYELERITELEDQIAKKGAVVQLLLKGRVV